MPISLWGVFIGKIGEMCGRIGSRRNIGERTKTMVTSIARQSVIIKCNLQKSVMLGNYEFYYAAGLVQKLFGLELTAEKKPQEISDMILSRADSLSPKDEKEKYLLELLERYEPGEEYDEQMKELFVWGQKEPDLWQVNTAWHPGK